MLPLIRSTAKDTIIYSIGTFSSRLVSIVLIPLYTTKFSLNDYGIMGLAEISIQLLTAFVGLGLFNALFRWYWDSNYVDKQKSIFFNILLTTGLFSCLVGVIFFVFDGDLSSLIFSDSKYTYLVRLTFIVSFLESTVIIISTLFRLRRQAIAYTLLSIIKLVINLLINIYLIVYKNRGIESVYESQAISGVIYLVIVIWYTTKNIRIKFEPAILKDMLIFCLPLLLTSLAGISLSVADRYVLKYLVTLDDVGIYTLGFKLANTIRVFIITSVNLAISPIIYKIIDQPGNKRFYSKIMTYYTFGLLFFVMGFSVFSREIIVLLAENKVYYDAYKIVPILSYGLLFSMLRDVSLIGINISKKTKITAAVLVFVTLLNLGFNFLFIPYFHYFGSSIAMLLSNVAYFIIILYQSQKYFYIPYELKKVLLMIVISVVICFSTNYINTKCSYLNIGLKLISMLSFPFILYFFKFYDEIELQRINGFYKKWRNPLNWKNNFIAAKKK